MAGSPRRIRCGRTHALRNVVVVVAYALLAAGCSSPSYLEAAMQAQEGGDLKTAIRLAKKEVARFSEPDQCSRVSTVNCGTLALAYATLASCQILDGDRTAGEESLIGAKGALALTNPEIKASATAMVYRDVSEAYWKLGDRARAVAVFKEGSVAGADSWLYMSSAAQDASQQPAVQQPTGQQPALQPPKGQPPIGQPPTGRPPAKPR
jgi:hypothetical protein